MGEDIVIGELGAFIAMASITTAAPFLDWHTDWLGEACFQPLTLRPFDLRQPIDSIKHLGRGIVQCRRSICAEWGGESAAKTLG